METLFFYLFATIAVVSAFYVVLSKRPVYAVLSLVITMFSLSGLFAMLQAHFLAMIQVLIYAGAILVLFLFILMLIGLENSMAAESAQARERGVQILKSLLTAIFLAEILLFLDLSKKTFHSAEKLAGTVETIGRSLFHEYLFPFELVSLLLLVGVIGVVSLTRKETAV